MGIKLTENITCSPVLGVGEMAERIRAFAWNESPLGSPTQWPAELLSTLNICLGARFPMAIYWAESGYLFYNDAWRPILGNKHPWALGKPAHDVWPEIWEAINPLFESVRQTGEATWRADELLSMHRYGYTEECYFDYTFNPILGAEGKVVGILNIVQETTFRVLNERRTNLLRELAACSASATTERGACELIAIALANDPKDVPFALLYVVTANGKSVSLLASTGVPMDSSLRAVKPEVLEDSASGRWPLSAALRDHAPVVVNNLSERFGIIPAGPWPEPITQAIILPAGGGGGEGIETLLVLGINPRRALDAEYQRFVDLISSHVASILASARAHEKLQTVLSSITDGLAVLDKSWNYTYVSEQAARIIGMHPDELLGHCVWDLFPDAESTQFYEGYHRAVNNQESVHFEEYYPHPLNKWLECHCYPSDAGLSVYFHDITQRKQAENDLRDANAQLADRATHLEALVQQRTVKLMETIGELEAFSYSIAHDMRAPLRSLQGYSQILTADFAPQLESEAQEYLHRIAKSANRMDKLIQDVLNYSKVVQAELPLEPVNVEHLLRGILDTYPMFTTDKVDVVLLRPFVPVLGNEAMLMQIFSNLMGNAVKFVAPGVKPSIQIGSEARGSIVCLHVQDNGIGIAEDQHEKIFQIFQQVERGGEGTGIGLAIVRKAVERMGGKISLESQLGKGSTFQVELRRA